MKRIDKNRIKLIKGEYERKNGTYEYRYKDIDGKTKSIYAENLQKLRAAEKAIKKDVVNGNSPVNTAKSLNQVFEEYKAIKQNIIRDSTFANYMSLYNLYIKNGLGKKKISDIKQDDIVRHYSRLHESGCTITTVDSLHTVVHGIFTYCVEQRYLQYNPADRCMVKLKQAEKKNTIKDISEDDESLSGRCIALTVAEEKTFIEFIKKHKVYNKWYNLMVSSLLFGPRLGEIAALQWNDIDWAKNTIRINKTLVYLQHPDIKKQVFQMHAPKTETGLRWIVMTKPLRAIFEEMYEVRKEKGKGNANVDGYDDFIFLNRFGQPFQQNSINKAIKRIVRDCNIEQLEKEEKYGTNAVILPDFASHTFRRTFATRMVEIGLNIKVLQNILGHTDSGTTLNFYAKAQRELKEEQTELIDEKYAKMFVSDVIHEGN